MDEEDFPRGGVSRKNVTDDKLKSGKEGDRDLFKTSSEKSKSGKKRKGLDKSNVKVKKQKVSPGSSFSPNSGQVELLNLKTICPGLLTLGVVKEIHDYELVVCLPNGLVGNVAVTCISDHYSALLEKCADQSLDPDQELHGLDDLFKVGQLVRCKVLEVTCNATRRGKSAIKLSIKPSDVNSDLTTTNLKSGQVLCGCVISQEDHGYVLDLGIKRLKTFLTNDNAEKFIQTCNEGYSLKLGQYLHCLIESSDHLGLLIKENRSLQVTIDPSKVKAAKISKAMKLPLSALLPGMVVNGLVHKVFEVGLRIDFLTYKAGIHKSHLPKSITKYEVQSQVTASILFINPTTKSVTMSLLPHLSENPSKPCSLFKGVRYADILKECKVLWVEKTRGVGLSLSESVTGFCSKKNLSDKEVTDIPSQFKKGDTHRCRILGFDYMDRIVTVTMKKSILGRKFMKLGDIELGSVVECNVRLFHSFGMSVIVANQIRGFVPNLHLADVPLKHPEKKYKEGDKLKCRVLQVDLLRSKLILSNKKSLVKSSLPIITSYQQVAPGMELEGFIACIKPNGVLVVFYNRVKGWVRKNELSTEPVDYPEKIFYQGQVVRCKVQSMQQTEEKMLLSFRLSDGSPSKKSKHKPAPADWQIGKILDCRVIRKKESGLDVAVLPEESPAYLPLTHLSDSLENSHLMMSLYEPGVIIKDVMYLSHTTHTVLSHKFSMVMASRESHLISDFAQIKPGLLLPGMVKTIMKYGLFIEFPGGMMGLAPNKFVCDRHLNDIPKEFPVGTSVNAKVMEVDQEKKRCLVSLRLSDCFHGNTENIVDITRTLLQEKEEITQILSKKKGKNRSLLSRLSDLKPGQIVNGTVTEITPHQITCTLGGDLKAVSFQKISEESAETGDEVTAVVLDIDLISQCVEISLCPELLHAVQNKKQNRFTKVRNGQTIKGEIILLKPEYALLSLKGHATGVFAYLPVKKHLNDVLERRNYELGDLKSIIIKNVEKEFLFGNWLENEKSPDHTGDLYDIHKPRIKIGTITKALVKAVHDFQMNLILKNSAGRVHITQVDGHDAVGTCPMAKYKQHVGERISVKVVGFREVKAHKFLPISHTSATKSVPECSVITSKLKKTGLSSDEGIQTVTVKVGDKVLAYVDHFTSHYVWFVISPSVRARAHVLHLSTDTKVLDKRKAKFRSGQVCEATVIGVTDQECLDISLIGQTEELEVGSLTRGLIVGTNSSNTALNVHLLDNYVGRVWLTDVMDNFMDHPFNPYKAGGCVQCKVIRLEPVNDKEGKTGGQKQCTLSLRPSRCATKKTERNTKIKVDDPEISDWGELKVDQVLRGYVVKHLDTGMIICVGNNINGFVQNSCISSYKIKDVNSVLPPGKVVTVKIINLEGELKKMLLSAREDDTGHPANIPEELKKNKNTKKPEKKSNSDKNAEKTMKRKPDVKDDQNTNKSKRVKRNEKVVKADEKKIEKNEKTEEESMELRVKTVGDTDSEVDSEDEVSLGDSEVDSEDQVTFKKTIPDEKPRLQLSSSFSWDVDYTTVSPSGGKGEISSDSEGESEPDQKSRHKTKKAMLKEKSREEKRLFKLEREQVEGSVDPQTADDFDRLVLQSPDSSVVWIHYMAHHLELTEIEKARVVAEKALQTINFREEQEKLNVWVGYFNLENLYGTPESLTKILQRALQQNDQFSIYNQLVNIYIKSEKLEEAEKLYQTITKKFSANKDVWTKFGWFYFKHDKMEAGRKLLQQGLKCLDKREHVELISKFAELEFKFGECERGKTMFENILSNYPKRTDLWSVYIDMVTKLKHFDNTRKLYERVINTKLSVKKMKFFFKKYLDFEKAYGTDSSVNEVKQKALEYVDSQID